MEETGRTAFPTFPCFKTVLLRGCGSADLLRRCELSNIGQEHGAENAFRLRALHMRRGLKLFFLSSLSSMTMMMKKRKENKGLYCTPTK